MYLYNATFHGKQRLFVFAFWANMQLAVKQRKQTKKHKYSDLYHKNTDSEETVSADCPGLIMRSIRQDFFLH